MSDRPSRRELLGGSAKSSSVETESQSPEPTTQRIISKRDFLNLIGSGALAVALGSAAGAEAQAYETEEGSAAFSDPQGPWRSREVITSHLLRENQGGSYTETALEAGLMLAAKTLVAFVFEKSGVTIGNAAQQNDPNREEFEKANPTLAMLTGGVLAPILEEATMRLLPSIFYTDDYRRGERDPRKRWDVGIPVAAVFALAHNIHRDADKKLVIDTKTLPATQFMGGLFYWYLMRERGYSHAALAHVVNNSTAIAIGKFLIDIFPGSAEKGTIDHE